MEYRIRSLHESELEEMIQLTSTAFESTPEAFRRIYENDPFYDFSLTRVAEHQGRLISYMRAAPRTIWIGPATLRMGGIAEVCTLQEFRRRGISTTLLKDMIHLLIEKDFPVSMLYGRDTFYRRPGWELCSIVQNLTIPMEDIPYKALEGVRQAEERDLDSLISLYEQRYAGHSCCMVRNRLHFKVRIMNRCDTLVYGEDHPTAYICVKMASRDDTRVIQILEAGWSDRLALLALLGYLKESGEGNVLAYTGYPGDDIIAELSLPGSSSSTSWSGMFRVNSVELTLQSMKPCFDSFPGKLSLIVHDDVVDGNNGIFTISGRAGDITIETASHKTREWIEADVRQLSQLVPGTVSASQLYLASKIRASSPRAIRLADGLFPQRFPYQPSLDHF